MTFKDRTIETLEDFAENLAAASEEDSFAKINQLVTESVNEATTAINQAALEMVEQLAKDSKHLLWDYENSGTDKEYVEVEDLLAKARVLLGETA
jgi:hypothetical protein